MTRIILLLALALVIALVPGCTQKSAVTTLEPEATAEQEAAAEEAPGEVAMVEEDVTGQEIARAGAETVEGTVDSEMVEAAAVEDVYFDFDRSDIRPDAKPALMRLSDMLMESGGRVIIEGHCDERGTNQYNLALGDRRSNAAKDFLVASGVPANRIETVSYGEEKPQCQEKTETCWALNRRAHFVLAAN